MRACNREDGGAFPAPRLVRGPGESPQGPAAGCPSFGAPQRFWASPHLGCRVCPQGWSRSPGSGTSPQCLHIVLGPAGPGCSQEEAAPGPGQVILSTGAGLWLQTGLSGFNAVGGTSQLLTPAPGLTAPPSHSELLPCGWTPALPLTLGPQGSTFPRHSAPTQGAPKHRAVGSPCRTLQLSWRRPRGRRTLQAATL